MITLKIINRSPHSLPYYASSGAAGMDICAHLEQPVTLSPFERMLIPTGLFIELPDGYRARLRARSGNALKKGLMLPNAPATINSDYRGEIKVIVANISTEPQTIEPGERIAQLIVARYETVEWQAVTHLSETSRSEGGFGSTGK